MNDTEELLIIFSDVMMICGYVVFFVKVSFKIQIEVITD